MKIGIITSWMRLGWGVDLTLHLTASALTSLGHEVRLYAANHDGSFANAPYELIYKPIVPHKLFPRFEWRARRYIGYFNDEPNEVYLIATQPYFYYPWFLKAPCVNYEFGIVPTTGFSWRKKMLWAYMRFSQFYMYHPAASALVANSEFTKSALPWYDRRKTRVIYHGIEHYDPHHPDYAKLFPSPILEPHPTDPSKPKEVPVDRRTNEELRAEFRKKHGFSEKDVVCLYVGRVNPVDQPYKGTAELFELAPSLKTEFPNMKWVMVGLGTEKDAELCRQSGIIPLLNHPDWKMRQVFVGCDLYVTASKWEGFNLPILEAQYFGKPVLAYKLAAHPEVVKDGVTGFLVKDKSEFRLKLRELIREGKLREELGSKGPAWAKRFNWMACARGFEGLFGEVVG
ncbi:MAG: glycosyltransferase family 4 protein [bacterium]|nr:glycosyltransferase family 4 protein [bacterium]